jgi:hypothetical protein
MTQIGEGVSVAVENLTEEPCSLCGKRHPAPKLAQITETAPGKTGWHRKTMKGIFESDGTREQIYSAGFPPSYAYQGHHCLALSALVRDANSSSPKDRRKRLNFYMDKVGFFPNRPRNCIALPARREIGDFEAFWRSLDLDRPLQMHGPGHDEAYFTQCENLIGTLGLLLEENCEGEVEQACLDQLKQLIEWAENFAFRRLAHFYSGWRLHVAEQAAACRLYSASPTNFETVSGTRRSRTIAGLGRPSKAIVYPNPQLPTGVFGG